MYSDVLTESLVTVPAWSPTNTAIASEHFGVLEILVDQEGGGGAEKVRGYSLHPPAVVAGKGSAVRRLK